MIEFILTRWTFPSLIYWITVFPVGILLGGLAGWFAGWIKERFDLHVGYSRKIFHFIIFTLAGITGLMGGFKAVQVFGASLVFIVGYAYLKGDDSRFFRAIARPSDAPYQKFYIATPFLMTALGGMISNILFGPYAVIGYITTGWGDAVAEPAGTRWGRHKYRVPTLTGIKAYRSVEGSAAVFTASFLGCGLFLFAGFHLPIGTALAAAALTALTATLVEAVTFHSLDNLTIQISASGICLLLVEYLL